MNFFGFNSHRVGVASMALVYGMGKYNIIWKKVLLVESLLKPAMSINTGTKY